MFKINEVRTNNVIVSANNQTIVIDGRCKYEFAIEFISSPHSATDAMFFIAEAFEKYMGLSSPDDCDVKVIAPDFSMLFDCE